MFLRNTGIGYFFWAKKKQSPTLENIKKELKQ